MKSICQDKEYSEDHDYYNCIQEFDRKDMLTLALYQEWVKRRYTKPTFYKTVGISMYWDFFCIIGINI